jgi:hypothetical protein
MTRDTNRRAVMGAVLAAGAFVAVPASATEVGVDPDLQALVAIFRGAKRRLEETSEAHGAALMRASDRCPVPESLIATDTDAGYWGYGRSGYQYFDSEVASLRVWAAHRWGEAIHASSRADDRAREIVAAWDRWHADRTVAKEREGVAEAEARHSEAVDAYHAIGRQIAKLRAKTMADVIAKLLAAAPDVLEEDSESDEAYTAILAGAVLDAAALANVQIREDA